MIKISKSITVFILQARMHTICMLILLEKCCLIGKQSIHDLHILPCKNQCTKWEKYSKLFPVFHIQPSNITVLAVKWTELLITNRTKPTTYITELTNSGKTYLLLLMPVHRAVLPHPTAEAIHAFLEEVAFPVWWSYTIRFSQVCWCMEDYTKRKKKKKINSYFGESTDSVSR